MLDVNDNICLYAFQVSPIPRICDNDNYNITKDSIYMMGLDGPLSL